MKLYIAGPMTGIEHMNFPAFMEAEKKLQAMGFETMNPARHGAGEGTWSDYMRRDITDLLTCDGVATLNSWNESKGATLEVQIAETLEMPVAHISEWLDGF